MAATATAPDGGYTIKGNEDSMLYHSTARSTTRPSPKSGSRDRRAGRPRDKAAVPLRRVRCGGRSGRGRCRGGEVRRHVDREITGRKPYGPGSARVAAGPLAPSGYDIKGNEDSMLYHTTDSPSYKQTIAEMWFRDVETAEEAGFPRWDSGKSQRGEG